MKRDARPGAAPIQTLSAAAPAALTATQPEGATDAEMDELQYELEHPPFLKAALDMALAAKGVDSRSLTFEEITGQKLPEKLRRSRRREPALETAAAGARSMEESSADASTTPSPSVSVPKASESESFHEWPDTAEEQQI